MPFISGIPRETTLGIWNQCYNGVDCFFVAGRAHVAEFCEYFEVTKALVERIARNVVFCLLANWLRAIVVPISIF
jgi:hypothetical protein